MAVVVSYASRRSAQHLHLHYTETAIYFLSHRIALGNNERNGLNDDSINLRLWSVRDVFSAQYTGHRAHFNHGALMHAGKGYLRMRLLRQDTWIHSVHGRSVTHDAELVHIHCQILDLFDDEEKAEPR